MLVKQPFNSNTCFLVCAAWNPLIARCVGKQASSYTLASQASFAKYVGAGPELTFDNGILIDKDVKHICQLPRDRLLYAFWGIHFSTIWRRSLWTNGDPLPIRCCLGWETQRQVCRLAAWTIQSNYIDGHDDCSCFPSVNCARLGQGPCDLWPLKGSPRVLTNSYATWA